MLTRLSNEHGRAGGGGRAQDGAKSDLHKKDSCSCTHWFTIKLVQPFIGEG